MFARRDGAARPARRAGRGLRAHGSRVSRWAARGRRTVDREHEHGTPCCATRARASGPAPRCEWARVLWTTLSGRWAYGQSMSRYPSPPANPKDLTRLWLCDWTWLRLPASTDCVSERVRRRPSIFKRCVMWTPFDVWIWMCYIDARWGTSYYLLVEMKSSHHHHRYII